MAIEKILGFENNGIIRVGVCDEFRNDRVKLREAVVMVMPVGGNTGDLLAGEYFNVVHGALDKDEVFASVEINPLTSKYDMWDLTRNYQDIINSAL
jgi:hypothetical protein